MSVTDTVTDSERAAALLADFAARGIRWKVYRTKDGLDVVWRPWNRVTEADRAALRENWDAVNALVLAEYERASATSSSPAPAGTDPRGLARTDRSGPAQPPLSPSAPASPRPSGPPAPPTRDAAWFDVRGGKRVAIARCDPKKTDDFLELVRRSALRRTD